MSIAERTAVSGVALLAALASMLLLIEQVRYPAAPTYAELTKRSTAAATGLIIPVLGVSSAELADTWGQARAEGRNHEGIDIIAPYGAVVVAAADGRIVKFFDSVRGGTTIYQFDTSERLVFYYAHLGARARGLAEGDFVRQGQIIGAVGASGNASTPHLHFEIQHLGPDRHWWVADSVNPFPYLRAGQQPR